MTVLAKTTRENGRHARPSHTLPVPPMLQLTKTNPEFSSAEALPCAVTAPFTNLDPCGTGFAIEINWQLYNTATQGFQNRDSQIHRQMEVGEKARAQIYLVEGSSVSEDEIDGALDVAIFEVMATTVVVESVLSAEESAAPKCRLVSADSNRHRLCSDVARPWNWRHILPKPQKYLVKIT